MILSQKAQNKDLRERAKHYDKMTYEEMRKTGKALMEQNEINDTFYRSQLGEGTNSAGVSGIMG